MADHHHARSPHRCVLNAERAPRLARLSWLVRPRGVIVGYSAGTAVARAGGRTGLTEAHQALFIAAARALTGGTRRVFMARTVADLGPGRQRRAEREHGWDRGTIREGARELACGFASVDACALRGRKRAEAHLPNLLADLEVVVAGQSRADPAFRTTRLYTRLTAAEVRRQLIAWRGYTDEPLPCVRTIGAKLNALG
jgi:hypothetical protein